MGGFWEESFERNERRYGGNRYEENHGDDFEDDGNWWIYLVVILGVLVFLAIVISIAVCCSNAKRKGQAECHARPAQREPVYHQPPPPSAAAPGYYYGTPDYSNQPAYQPYQPYQAQPGYQPGYNYNYLQYSDNNDHEGYVLQETSKLAGENPCLVAEAETSDETDIEGVKTDAVGRADDEIHAGVSTPPVLDDVNNNNVTKNSVRNNNVKTMTSTAILSKAI